MTGEDHAARDKARTAMLNKLVRIQDGWPSLTVGIVTRLDYEHIIHPDRPERATQEQRDSKLVVELEGTGGVKQAYWLHLYGDSRWEVHGQGVYQP